MQEDIENKTVTLVINGSKFTGNVLKNAISKLLAHQKSPKEHKDVTPHGKQTVRQLAQQNQGISNIEIKDKSICFSENAKKMYGGGDHAGKVECSVLESMYPGTIKLERLCETDDWFARHRLKWMWSWARPGSVSPFPTMSPK